MKRIPLLISLAGIMTGPLQAQETTPGRERVHEILVDVQSPDTANTRTALALLVRPDLLLIRDIDLKTIHQNNVVILKSSEGDKASIGKADRSMAPEGYAYLKLSAPLAGRTPLKRGTGSLPPRGASTWLLHQALDQGTYQGRVGLVGGPPSRIGALRNKTDATASPTT
ncbi:MAG: hypothetical protein AAF492_18580, partial [Verrucomicrobiota bacterium]